MFSLISCRGCSLLFIWVGVKLVSTSCESARTLTSLLAVLGFPKISAYLHCQVLWRFLLQCMRSRIEMMPTTPPISTRRHPVHRTHQHERQQPAERESQEGKHPPEEEPPPALPGLVANGHDRSPPSFRSG